MKETDSKKPQRLDGLCVRLRALVALVGHEVRLL